MMLLGPYVGFQFVLTLYLQALNRWSPIETALAFLPLGAWSRSDRPAGPLIHRVGTPRLIALGFLAMASGYTLALRIGVVPEYARFCCRPRFLSGWASNLPSALNIRGNKRGLTTNRASHPVSSRARCSSAAPSCLQS